VVAVRAANAAKFTSAPPATCSAVLVFGTDDGLVSERAKQIADAFSRRDDPPAEIIRIEDTDLDGEPDRLVIELQTMPMFGGAKVVRSTMGRRVNGALQLGECGRPRRTVPAGGRPCVNANDACGLGLSIDCGGDCGRRE